MSIQSISIGDLVLDSFGREGIVFAKQRRPSAKWLAEQGDSRVQQSAGPWWTVLPLSGGSVIVPSELGTFVRRATVDDVLQLIEAQQTEHAGTVTLVSLFEPLRLKRPKN